MIKKRTGHHRGGPSPSFLGKGALKLGTVGDFREHAVVLRIRRPRTLPFFACISSKWLASVWIKLRVPSRRRPGGPLHPLVPWGPSAAAARVLSMDSPEQKATNDTLTRQWSKWSVCKSKYLHTWLSSSVPRHFCDRRLFSPFRRFSFSYLLSAPLNNHCIGFSPFLWFLCTQLWDFCQSTQAQRHPPLSMFEDPLGGWLSFISGGMRTWTARAAPRKLTRSKCTTSQARFAPD